MRQLKKPPSGATDRGGRAAPAGMALIVAIALGATLVPGTSAQAEATAQSTFSETVNLTLITGDRVTVQAGTHTPIVQAGAGREAVSFSITEEDDGLHVVPSDAARFLAAGSLDDRLFNVTALIDQGYADEERDDIPLIVRGGDDFRVADTGSKRLDSLGVSTATQPKSSAVEFWSTVTDAESFSDGVVEIWLDGKRELLLDASVPQIGAPEAWDAGYTGAGTTIAVLDTGIDAEHPDFADNLVEAVDFTGDDVSDVVGHGTHVASTIAGSGAGSDGRYVGVAPEAQLLIGKVCPDRSCDESAILAGMEWAAQSGATAVNLSLGGGDTPQIDPLEQAVNDLTEQYGTLFVTSAGNNYGEMTVGSPGSADAALTVGAVDREDELADFSSRGPRVGDYALKPDITAPGVDIVAAKAVGTELGEPVGDHYTTASGTSMAAPHVAGAVAILAQQHPDWTPEQLKAALMASAEPNPDLAAHEQGAGRVDVSRAVDQQVTAAPASVSVGLVEWSQDGEPVEETITYSNPTDEVITLDFTVEATGPDGEPVDVVSVDTDGIEVPAGGEAQATVTTDVTGDVADGYYSATITAAAGSVRVVTPLAVTKEPESYDLELEGIDRDGSPAEYFEVYLSSRSPDGEDVMLRVNGSSVTQRVRSDDYHVHVWIRDDASGILGDHIAIVEPLRRHTEDGTAVYDARDAEPVSIEVPNGDVDVTSAFLGYSWSIPTGDLRRSVQRPDFTELYSAQYGEAVSGDELRTEIHGVWRDNVDSGGPITQVYSVALAETGEFPTGYDTTMRDEDFAEVVQRVYGHGDNLFGSFFWWLDSPNLGAGFVFPAPVPGTVTAHYNPGGDFTRESRFTVEQGGDGSRRQVSMEHAVPADHEPGQSYEEAWNAAVNGPAFPGPGDWASREGADLHFDLQLYSGPGLDRYGYAISDTGGIALYNGETLVDETAGTRSVSLSGLPAEPTEYRLVVEDDRTGQVDLASQLRCEWRFSSSAGDTELPLIIPRLAPQDLDATNSAGAGVPIAIPITVQDIAGEVVDPVELSVEVSFDGGASWQMSPVEDDALSVTAPEGSEYVSLRAEAVDDAGHSVSLTIINAYGVN